MAIIRDGEFAEDIYLTLGDDDALPADSAQAIILGVDRWQNRKSEISARDGALGIVLNADQIPDLIADDLSRFDVVVINFPVFSDGRGFSHARRLREHLGYKGEIRASGHIIRDQYLFLHRCGVNAIEVESEHEAEQWKIAMDEFSLFYQNTVDGRNPLMRIRQTAERV